VISDGIRIWFDGVELSQFTFPGSTTPSCEAWPPIEWSPVNSGSILNNNNPTIGRDASFTSNTDVFNGLIDEVKIYKRALSAQEIDDIFNTGVCMEVIEVAIDIKPGSFPNCFNVDGNGVIPVAILGSADFDVSQIDTDSLEFAGLAVRVRGNDARQCGVEDVSGDFTSPEGAPDGFPDLVCQFVDDSEAWVQNDDSTATLAGNLKEEFSGTQFEGTDSICIVP
ncbi:MAG TPA: LamG-like jellyroll fold domain-containing protein, partial [Chryseolinea sp.]